MERDPLLGVELGGFRVRRKLAEGGMGIVYEAFHEALGRRAAVKVLKPEMARDEEWSRRFLVEARAMGALKHRNLIEVLNFGQTPDGRAFLMMEFLDGEPLDVTLAHGPLPASVALGIAEQIANGLSEAHKKGIVHRDLKPSNVHLLREHSGETLVKVLDFGLARQAPVSMLGAAHGEAPRQEASSLMAGTPEYIAPEQAQGKAVEAAADLYPLGIMLFEMLTGRLPFESKNVTQLVIDHIQTPPPRLSSLIDSLPEGLEKLVDSLLAKNPHDRPASADVVRLEIQRILKRLSAEVTSVRRLPVERPTAAPTVQLAPRRKLGLPALLVLGAAVLVAGIVLMLDDGPEPAVEAETLPPPPPALVALAPVPEPPPVIPAQVPEPSPEPRVSPPVAPKPPAPKSTEDRGGCSPDDEWKQRLRLDLTEMGSIKRVVEDARLYELWDQQQGPLSKAIAAAKTRAQCAEVQSAYDRLRRQLRFQ